MNVFDHEFIKLSAFIELPTSSLALNIEKPFT
jgi:hypothetical protein